MIIKQDEGSPLGKAAEAAQELRDTNPEDLPPPYAAASTSSSHAPISPSVRPSNFLVISQLNGKIKNSYVIDPKMVIPLSMLPPLEKRKNLYLKTTNGSVEAEVTILPVVNHERATIFMKTTNGHIESKLTRPSVSPAIIFEGYTTNGHIRISVPRSFHGPVAATTTNGRVTVSDAVALYQTPFSDLKRKNKFFIGDVSQYLQSEGKCWEGDEVVVQTTNGSIKFFYDDEAIEPSKGFFSRIWGGFS